MVRRTRLGTLRFSSNTMDQRNFSPLASASSEKALQPIASSHALPEPSQLTILALATGVDNGHGQPHIDLKDSVKTEVIREVKPGKRHH